MQVSDQLNKQVDPSKYLFFSLSQEIHSFALGPEQVLQVSLHF